MAIAKEPVPRLGARWPKLASEKACARQLLEVPLGPWQIFLLDAIPDQTSTFMVTAMKLMDLDELRDAETKRLERLHALRLWGNAQQVKTGAVARTKYARTPGAMSFAGGSRTAA